MLMLKPFKRRKQKAAGITRQDGNQAMASGRSKCILNSLRGHSLGVEEQGVDTKEYSVIIDNVFRNILVLKR